MIPSKKELLKAADRIAPYVHKTPVLTSNLLNELCKCNIYFKCENFQRAGSFKIRGAVNAIMKLSEEEKKNGVVTHSSGNFAQALSLAATSLGIRSYVIMPKSAPEVKKQAVEHYGGEITLCKPTLQARKETAAKIQKEKKATLIHSSNNTDVIIGQGTAGIELLNEHPNLNYIFIPVGGGGLIAGNALAANYFGKNCKVIGVEPLEADDAYRSLKSGKIESNHTTNTIADGLKTQLGDKNFPIIKKHVSDIIRVTEEEIIEALKLIYERMKIIIEPSSAVAFAGLVKNKSFFSNKKVGVILSGGNIDLKTFSFG
ncbi:threonine/serine dehydratase [Leptobacterium sp. I13]|uniref:threonine ammonia-lyase n=1 Tax=Leptobacterium meishanense TaxID=3128904 RepID=UPI0030ED0EA4